ncbi:BlaI/MecI/CopY family transcriptional regulator [Oceanicaulis alexandrii]|uniref:BlaI/MecI/CopY family transcriptional regulator n=1 Tax=Oceanicaulis alexandrii TaxID=153233 RepID=UPI0003B4BCE9|nr:BlaI/MecI/CopY family transcriptional regulator [Oceanicaulis alexandrii]
MTTEPNPSELEVLKALWSHDRLSAREVHDQIGEAQRWSYSTTRTVIQRMVDKGLVNKDSVHGLAVFAAADRKVDLISRLVRSFTKRVLEADPTALPASAFAGSRLLDEGERAELDALLKAGADEGGHKDNEEEAGQ